MKLQILSLLAAGLVTTTALAPARAVELQQKWQAGQTLNYDLALNGSANLSVPADANVFFAGVPLQIEVTGTGVARLDTLQVDPSGEGTVLVEVPRFDLNGRTLGQKALLELRDGQPRVLINGKPINIPRPDPRKPLPKYALLIGKDGRIKGFKPLDKNGQLMAAPASPAPLARAVADEAAPVAPEAAVDRGALITSLILRALPTLWPQRDVQPGDTWETTLPLPPALARDANAAQTAAPLSQWTMTLKDQEEVDGMALWRVGVVGEIKVDGQTLAAPRAPRKGEKALPTVGNVLQRVDGDLWIDAAKGQVVRGDMVIDARGQTATADDAGRNSEAAWADFTGTFGLRLRDAVTQ